MMDNNRARRILDEARETLARTASVRVEHRSHRDEDDALVAWRAGMPKQSAPVTPADIDEKIAEHRRIWLEVHGRVIASERQRHRAALATVRTEFAADLAKLRKLVVDDRHLARSELRRVRADHDRQRASMLSEIEFQRAKIAELTVRLDGYDGKRSVDGSSRIIDMVPRRG